MDIPGMSGSMEDPALREKAEQNAERLLEELKEQVKVDFKDIGVLRKEATITVPEQVIADHLAQNYDDIMSDVVVPGFRKGRAPRQLVEKRFGAEVRESLTTTIIGQSFFAAMEKNDLEALGDPQFRVETDDQVKLMEFDEALGFLKLPPSGDFTYVCELELKPKFDLPEMKGIEVKMPDVSITDEMVDEQIMRQRKMRGRFEPVGDGAAEKDDMLIADIDIKVGEEVVKSENNAQVGVRATRVEGIPLPELEKVLVGAKSGESRTATGEIPDDFERADLRGKEASIAFKVHEIKRLKPAELDSIIQQFGYDDANDFRQAVREDIEAERDQMIQRAKKAQIVDYLVDNTELDLPEKLSARQVDRALQRRMLELQQEGVPESDVEAQMDELRVSAERDVTRQLKLDFILDKAAEELEIVVTDEEVNTEIARIARMYGRRFDRVRDDLQKQGLLTRLADQIRQDKVFDYLLREAKEVEVKQEDADKDAKK